MTLSQHVGSFSTELKWFQKQIRINVFKNKMLYGTLQKTRRDKYQWRMPIQSYVKPITQTGVFFWPSQKDQSYGKLLHAVKTDSDSGYKSLLPVDPRLLIH